MTSHTTWTFKSIYTSTNAQDV